MKGYIYITGQGADPAHNNAMKDPLFIRVPTLGACMPNIRRNVSMGDWIFVVSGKTEGVQQYVVGGLRVEEKISALAAYERFPENRLMRGEDGRLVGNIIVQPDGTQHPLDTHKADSFESRIRNYIVGSEAVALTTEQEVRRGRAETLRKLAEIVGRQGGNRVVDLLGRGARRLNEGQVGSLLDWLHDIKSAPAQ
uniref:Nmad2 family putative nucleotide modification protein n=1 Tax=Azospirillum argentinense TaxID=2970906 RepID=UPI0010C0418B|nr:hypothetical protein [Azospirillum argentinense]